MLQYFCKIANFYYHSTLLNQMKVNTTFQNNNDKSNLPKQALGITAGLVVGLSPLPLLLRDKIATSSESAFLKKQEKLLNSAKEMDSFENIRKYADDILSKPELENKRIKIQDKYPEKMLRTRFDLKNNVVLVNSKSGYTSVFQEIGHAINFHKGGFTKSLLSIKKPVAKIVPIIGISGLVVKLLHTKKKNKNKTFFEKTKDFYSDNAGAILFAAYGPILLEEAIASKNAAKLAKPYLTKLQHQNHIKKLCFAFVACLSIPVMFATATNLGVYTKNKITNAKGNPP